MASAEEIRARVKRADEQRITTRANAAARVGEIADERDELVGTLAKLTKDLGCAVSDALTMMTADELAQFTGRQHREVNEWTASGKSNSRRRSTSSRPARSSRQPSGPPRGTESSPSHPATEPSGPAPAAGLAGTVEAVVSPTAL